MGTTELLEVGGVANFIDIVKYTQTHEMVNFTFPPFRVQIWEDVQL